MHVGINTRIMKNEMTQHVVYVCGKVVLVKVAVVTYEIILKSSPNCNTYLKSSKATIMAAASAIGGGGGGSRRSPSSSNGECKKS